MNSYNFFTRDVFLKRQPRIRKQPCSKSTPSSSLPLHIIPEEDEPRTSYSCSSSSRSPSPMTVHTPNLNTTSNHAAGVKAKRRHANVTVSDIRVTRPVFVHNDNDVSETDSSLLTAPRPAPRPPTSMARTSPIPSPDSFSLTFTDLSLRFPHPPIPTPSSSASFDNHRVGLESPTPSMSTSSATTSPDTRSTGLPATPSSSDDEFPSYYSSAIPTRRASIKPLVITKRNSSPHQEDSDSSVSATLLQPGKTLPELSHLSPITSEESSSDSEDSDSEWYTQEFSKILTLCSPSPSQQSRPDSIALPSPGPMSPSPASRPTSISERFPSAQLDPSYPRKRRSRVSIPKYPPPPVPTIPAHLRSPSTSSVSPSSPAPSTNSKSSIKPNLLSVTPPPVRRPPPRSSIPADCVFVDESYAFSDDSGSSFSFSLYDDATRAEINSPMSLYSQPSPAPSPFPSSFPSSPFSPESAEVEFEFPVDEIQFEMELDHTMMLPLSLPTSPIDLESDIAHGLEELRFGNQIEERLRGLQQAQPSAGSGTDAPLADEIPRGLRSKWSSSTLSSVREEHARRSGGGTSAKLRSYFGGSPISVKGRVPSRKGTGSIPPTPLSPSKRFRHVRQGSDVVVVGYGQQGVRRRGSTTTISDAGSVESTSSSGSNGLRRKPIPVEMFLRTGA